MSLARSPVNIHRAGTTRALEEEVGGGGSQRQTQAWLGLGFGQTAGKPEGTAVTLTFKLEQEHRERPEFSSGTQRMSTQFLSERDAAPSAPASCSASRLGDTRASLGSDWFLQTHRPRR